MGAILKFSWRTSNASRLGQFYSTDPEFGPRSDKFSFNTSTDPVLYTVEGADALEPIDSSAITLFRYRENNMSAGVAFRDKYGVVALGFPFETIVDQEMRDIIMKKTLNYLLEKKDEE